MSQSAENSNSHESGLPTAAKRQEKLRRDLAEAGNAFVMDGERVDPADVSAVRREFVCPRGHRHYEGSAFCTVCGAGPVLHESASKGPDAAYPQESA